MAAMDDPHSNHVVHLYDPAHLQVRVDVPLAEASRVGIGHKARIVVEVLPDRVFQGEVTRIVNEADLQKNTLQVKVRILDPVPELKPEMLARAQFLAPAPAAEAGRSGVRPGAAGPAGQGHSMKFVAGSTGWSSRTARDGVIVIASLPGDRIIDARGLRRRRPAHPRRRRADMAFIECRGSPAPTGRGRRDHPSTVPRDLAEGRFLALMGPSGS
jgi:hypothetical protein